MRGRSQEVLPRAEEKRGHGGEKGTATVLTVKHVEPAPGARGSDV